jgi:transposase InsO family protein
MVQAVVAERATLTGRGLDCGAVSIRYWLRRAGVDAPSARTIHRILVSSGLVEPQPKKRPRSSYRRFQAASPNGCWQMDGMKWPLLDGAVVTVLRVQDDHSRKIMASRAALSENTDDVWACLLAAFARHGRPAMLLTDGGSAFTMRRIHGSLGALEARLRRCGILPVVASPAHPRTCGKKEREWQTLQAWLKMRPPAKDLPGLQRQLDAYDLIFNHERPHQAHHGATPDETFAASPKARAADAALAPPMSLTRVRARLNGVIDLGGGLKTSIGTEWAYAQVTVLREDPAVAIFHDDDLIDFLHIDPSRKYQLRSSR